MAPPEAARLDPRDAYCSRLPPCPHRSRRAMRPRRITSGRAPLSLAPPAPSRSQVAATAARRVHFCPFAILIQRRPSLPVFRPQPARSPVAARGSSPERRGRDRQRVPAASSRRSRRGVLSVGVALLSPARPFPVNKLALVLHRAADALISFSVFLGEVARVCPRFYYMPS